MARKTVLVCDNCGREVGEGKGATLRLNYTDARRGSKQADLCDNCAGEMPGHAAARRGRRPKSAVGCAERSFSRYVPDYVRGRRASEPSDRRSTIGRWPRAAG